MWAGHLAAAMVVAAPLHAAELGSEWLRVSGDWRLERELIRIVRQGATKGAAVAFCRPVTGTHGA